MNRPHFRTVTTFMAALLLAGGLAFASAPAASANEFHHGHCAMKHFQHHGGPIGFLLIHQDALGLSKGQVEKLSDLRLAFMKTRIREKAEIRILHMETMKLMMQQRIDTAQVDRNITQILAHKKKIKLAFVDMMASANRVLTPEQYAKAKKLFRKTILRMHEGFAMIGQTAQKG